MNNEIDPELIEGACQHQPVEEPMRVGPHHAKRVCAKCGKFLGWVGTPKVPLNKLRLPEFRGIAQLTGSEKQIRWATTLRVTMTESVARIEGQPALAEAMWAIADSSWWIANKDRSLHEIRWPTSWLGGAEEPKAAGAQPPAAKPLSADSAEFECPSCGISREHRAYCQNPECPEARESKLRPPALRRPAQAEADRPGFAVTCGPDQREPSKVALSLTHDGNNWMVLRLTRSELARVRQTIVEYMSGL